MSRQTGSRAPYGGNRNPAFSSNPKGGSAGGTNRGGSGGGNSGGGGQTCNSCGKTGHFARNCPRETTGGRPSDSGDNSRQRGTSAASPAISAASSANMRKEDAVVSTFEGAERTAVSKPCRPSYGTKGHAVEFETNYFPVRLPPELHLHRYEIEVQAKDNEEGKQPPKPNNKKLKQIIRLLLNKLESLGLNSPIATDFNSLLICSGEIPQHVRDSDIKYSHEDDATPGNHPQTYGVHITELNPALKISTLQDFLASTVIDNRYEHREPMLQALNIILGHHAKSTRTITMVGANRAYTNDPQTDKLDLSEGLEAIRGYFLSVRLTSLRTLVNVNVSHGAFYEAIELRKLIDHWTDKSQGWNWYRLETFLRGVKVRTNHLKDKNGNRVTKIQSIKGFASPEDGGGKTRPPHVQQFAAPPFQVWFHLDDDRDFAKQRHKTTDKKGVIKDKYISVLEFFESKYMIQSDPQERYPVINFGSKQDPQYVPAEACSVEPGYVSLEPPLWRHLDCAAGDTLIRFTYNSQLAKLTPNQTDAMIRFAARPPYLNATSITSKGLRTLGLSPTAPGMAQFGAEVDNQMVKVCGRMLSLPPVLYNKERVANQSQGGWNLIGMNFIRSVPKAKDGKLQNWGCLKSSDSRPNTRHVSAISQLKDNFANCGITTSLPREYDWTAKTLEQKIRAARQVDKMDILLIILPFKDTALYNRVKRCSDVTEGIHTVCVVGDKFYKCAGTYFGNVALKFNLKLGGTNHKLEKVDMGIISQGKTMVVGIDVVHPSPGSDNEASVASMVASIDATLAQWPVDLRVQVREKQEMLDKIDQMLVSRLDLWQQHHNSYPENILVYRDGVSEGQYDQVLQEELRKMREATQELYNRTGQREPRFTLIIVGKRHHTRFYPSKGHPASDKTGNPDRGLVVDRVITEPRNWDFFLQSHNTIQGTARPAHYFVLWDEIFTNSVLEPDHQAIQPGSQPADRLERLTQSLCYLFSRATKAVSIPAPVYYADIACERAGRYLAESPTGSKTTGTDNTKLTAGKRERLRSDLQKKIEVHKNLRDAMFYV